MSHQLSQGGLKHAATDPSQLDSKRERRRGAGGRAAALRRAPSDSDCSGDTASLSADSAERAPRQAPQPTAKQRSRRRGSEWEVLEGLKDGQRFDRRPEVFNGYLHKKRKWPLKGWHKRFFVVDGGILVYARSPADVARGRLHGSVDVGLSVISAKARRRRIDIDADEFIYHLRAKTPDVFRTWLSVLKAHRLYRQHLLMFGAREPVPKIHPPLDDIPPTDSSSPTETELLMKSLSLTFELNRKLNPYIISPEGSSVEIFSSSSEEFSHTRNNYPSYAITREKETPLIIKELQNPRSLCSMNCMARVYERQQVTPDCSKVYEGNARTRSPDLSGVTDMEKHMNSTDLDSLISPNMESSLLYEWTAALDAPKSNMSNLTYNRSNSKSKLKSSKFLLERKNTEVKRSNLTAMYFFSRKKSSSSYNTVQSGMRKSKKCTNLVKYRNLVDEPRLQRPFSGSMLLGHARIKVSKQTSVAPEAAKINFQNQVDIVHKENKSLQDIRTASECDRITEKLMYTVLQNHKIKRQQTQDTKCYISKIVKELYDTKFSDADPHPAKALFKSLLEFWMKSTSLEEVRNTLKGVKSIDRPSNRYFTRDKQISCGALCRKVSRQTQVNIQEKECHKLVSNDTQVYIQETESPKEVNNNTQVYTQKTESLKKVSKIPQEYAWETESPKVVGNNTQVYMQEIESPIVVSTKKTSGKSPMKSANDSYVKERRVQELERLLKNTVYICEAACSLKEKDIHMTKKLIDNIGKHNTYTKEENIKNESSTELPKIQATINQLISESSITSDMAKECLSAYLDVLMSDSTKNTNNSSVSSTDKSRDQTYDLPDCDVQTEAIQKKVSKSVTNILSSEKIEPTDPGQQYLKDVLDKITNILSKVNKPHFASWRGFNRESKFLNEYRVQRTMDGDYEGFEHSPKRSVFAKSRLDPKYNVERVSMFSDPTLKGLLSFTVSVKDTHISPLSVDKSNKKLSRENIKSNVKKSYEVLPSNSTTNFILKRKICESPLTTFKNPYMNCLPDATRDKLELRPFLSNSDATSKAYFHTVRESANSLNISCRSHKFSEHKKVLEDDCYLLSSFQKGLSPVATKFQMKRKSHTKYDMGIESDDRNIPERELSKDLSSPGKSTPKIIDEKFIILLMENLTLLSQNVPSLHKDINNLYLKIKKKHEKSLRSNSQRLGLLGKIYAESGKRSNDTISPSVHSASEPQACEANVCPDRLPKDCHDVAVNTSRCVCCFCTQTTHTGTQTSNTIESIEKEIPITTPCLKFHNKNASVQTKKYSDTISVNVALSAQLCTVEKGKKDCCLETVITSILDDDASQKNFKFVPKKDKKLGIEDSSKKAKLDWLKDYRLLPITIKVSTQSQTDRKFIKTLKGKRIEKDITAYPVLLKRTLWPARTTSATDSCRELKKYNSPNRSDEMKTLYRCSSNPSISSGLISPTTVRGPQAGFVSGTPGGRLASWIVESGGPLESVTRELGQAQLSVQQLQRLLDSLELQQAHHDTDVSLEGASPNVKKDRRKFGLRKKKSNSKCASVELAPPLHVDISTSHTALSTLTAPPSPGGGASSMPNSAASLPIACAATRPQSLPGAEALGPVAGPASLSSLTPDQQLREDFTVLAKDLVTTLKGVVSTLVCERSRLRAAMEAADNSATPGGAVVAALRTNLSSALQQNSELRNRLSRIHDASDLAEISSVNNSDGVPRQFQASLSYSSSCVSASEFFDAEEHDDDFKPAEIVPGDEAGVIELDGDSTSEAGSLSSEEGSASSDNSDAAMLTAEPGHLTGNGTGPSDSWARRTRLPCARPTPGGPSLWNLLYKNIGKDLSQVSMPVTINEPLNMLQRLCEELEYSELLDSASECQNAIERMALIAAFAVSAYAATAHRAASKPFNPLLHETYECVRTDRGFRFIAEQVSHHPPISACHAESSRWCFWQEARIKTKFWGKSMEFQPTGRAHARLLPSGDHYSWNKVTTCVHNLFGGQRWVDQYGDMHITCHGTDITCKLNFIKASSWSSSRHEVRGAISQGGLCKLRLHGRWSEALYAGEPPAARCLWRPGAMPPDHDLYYGFTRFAMELNELEPGMKEVLPHTDTRLRPDQRALEEGDVEAAERYKHSLEQAQRERRRDRPDQPAAWFRKAVEEGEETWVFSGEYWRAREAGFPALRSPRVW